MAQPATVFALWESIDRLCAGEEDFYAGPMYRPEGGHLAPYMFAKLTGAPLWKGRDFGIGRVRATERQLSPSPNSVFKIVGAKTVGPGSFAGMRVLVHLKRRLGERVRVWPFEPADPACLTICEIYPSAYYRLAGSSRTRDSSAVASVLASFGAQAEAPPASQDEADALVSAAALRTLSAKPGAFAVPGPHCRAAEHEGWIFGTD